MTILFAVLTGLFAGLLIGCIGLGYVYVEHIGPTLFECNSTIQRFGVIMDDVEEKKLKEKGES